MAQKLKTSLAIVTTCVLIYLTSMAGVTTAQVGSAATEDMPTYATISLEACAVRLDMEAMEQNMAGSGYHALSSISAEQVLSRIEADEGEVISSLKAFVAEGAVAEIATENNAREKVQDQEQEQDGYSEWETAASLRAEIIGIDAGRIGVEFCFKQVFSELGSSEEDEGEREEEHTEIFEVSSSLFLSMGRPVIAGAKENEDGAMFLILYGES